MPLLLSQQQEPVPPAFGGAKIKTQTMGQDFKVKRGPEAEEPFPAGGNGGFQQEQRGAFGVGAAGFTFWSILRLGGL